MADWNPFIGCDAAQHTIIIRFVDHFLFCSFCWLAFVLVSAYSINQWLIIPTIRNSHFLRIFSVFVNVKYCFIVSSSSYSSALLFPYAFFRFFNQSRGCWLLAAFFTFRSSLARHYVKFNGTLSPFLSSIRFFFFFVVRSFRIHFAGHSLVRQANRTNWIFLFLCYVLRPTHAIIFLPVSVRSVFRCFSFSFLVAFNR